MNFVSNYKKLLRKLLFYLGEPSWIKKIQNRGNVIEATHQTMLDFGIIEYRPSFDIIEKNITAQYETILHKFIIEELKKSMDQSIKIQSECFRYFLRKGLYYGRQYEFLFNIVQSYIPIIITNFYPSKIIGQFHHITEKHESSIYVLANSTKEVSDQFYSNQNIRSLFYLQNRYNNH
ncbi:hypothetical protein RFI_34047 [Reticulomyxa filosa]|uniref:Uncharacterized protein n=1 Tax=Reticulomyxa filosa TaxID=46433 RepID=X6LN86_RETFI|nr:hypothetical protein RFI_34047 [Reticulomyxa filosa]|eukprot:ETO03363.1 hypothetical protein RFI_34047 [Reticulomyxa filosa]